MATRAASLGSASFAPEPLPGSPLALWSALCRRFHAEASEAHGSAGGEGALQTRQGGLRAGWELFGLAMRIFP